MQGLIPRNRRHQAFLLTLVTLAARSRAVLSCPHLCLTSQTPESPLLGAVWAVINISFLHPSCRLRFSLWLFVFLLPPFPLRAETENNSWKGRLLSPTLHKHRSRRQGGERGRSATYGREGLGVFRW